MGATVLSVLLCYSGFFTMQHLKSLIWVCVLIFSEFLSPKNVQKKFNLAKWHLNFLTRILRISKALGDVNWVLWERIMAWSQRFILQKMSCFVDLKQDVKVWSVFKSFLIWFQNQREKEVTLRWFNEIMSMYVSTPELTLTSNYWSLNGKICCQMQLDLVCKLWKSPNFFAAKYDDVCHGCCVATSPLCQGNLNPTGHSDRHQLF